MSSGLRYAIREPVHTGSAAEGAGRPRYRQVQRRVPALRETLRTCVRQAA